MTIWLWTPHLPYISLHFLNPVTPSNNQEENALKQKLRRLCEPKKGGRLQVPEWLHDEWRHGDHLALARQYQACNFNKAPLWFFFAKNLSVGKPWCSPKSLPAASHHPQSRIDCPERKSSSSTRRRRSAKWNARSTTWMLVGTQRKTWQRFSSGQRTFAQNQIYVTQFQSDWTTLCPKCRL